MADPVAAWRVLEPAVQDEWTGQGVRLPDVVEGLAKLQESPDAAQFAARTVVMTIIAVTASEEDAAAAADALRRLAGHHPARLVLVRPDPDAVAYLDGRATLYSLSPDDHRGCFEEVELRVGGQAALHLDSVVESFTLSDLPVVVWYVRAIPHVSDPLLSVATAVLIDSRDAPDPAQLRSLLALARRRTLVDLSWSRVQPWREMLASLFEPLGHRPWLEALHRIEIGGKQGPRRLLAGWLVAQTGVSPRQVKLHDARHVSIRLVAERPEGTATFTVERAEGQRLVVARAEVPGRPPLHASVSLPDDPLPSSLAAGLTHLRPDPVWETALSTAAAVAD